MWKRFRIHSSKSWQSLCFKTSLKSSCLLPAICAGSAPCLLWWKKAGLQLLITADHQGRLCNQGGRIKFFLLFWPFCVTSFTLQTGRDTVSAPGEAAPRAPSGVRSAECYQARSSWKWRNLAGGWGGCGGVPNLCRNQLVCADNEGSTSGCQLGEFLVAQGALGLEPAPLRWVWVRKAPSSGGCR